MIPLNKKVIAKLLKMANVQADKANRSILIEFFDEFVNEIEAQNPENTVQILLLLDNLLKKKDKNAS